MRYSKSNTIALDQCADCLKPLSTLLTDEGAKEGAVTLRHGQFKVVDFEALADKFQKGGDKLARVDIMYALHTKQLQLVECKLEVKNSTNFNNKKYKDDLRNKRTKSRDLCNSNFYDHPSLETVLLIVDDSIVESARSIINRIFPASGKNKTRHFEVLSIQGLLDKDFT